MDDLDAQLPAQWTQVILVDEVVEGHVARQ
jgi:hypothetical protein